MRHRLGVSVAARTQGERVRLVERALARQAGAHRNGEQLGELLQLLIGLGPMHALSGIQHGTLGVHQNIGCLGYGFRIRRRTRAHHRCVLERLRDFIVKGVVRNLDDHRLGAAVAQLRERAPEDVGHFGADRDGLAVFGHAGHLQRRVEIEGQIRIAARIAGRQNQHRNRVAESLRDTAVGVLGSRAVLHAERAQLAAAGEA